VVVSSWFSPRCRQSCRLCADHPLIAPVQISRATSISAGFDDLDARLTRIGYPPKALADQFDTRLPEMRRFLGGKLDAERTEEITSMMRRAGLPV
jgi:hypothetical protein